MLYKYNAHLRCPNDTPKKVECTANPAIGLISADVWPYPIRINALGAAMILIQKDK